MNRRKALTSIGVLAVASQFPTVGTQPFPYKCVDGIYAVIDWYGCQSEHEFVSRMLSTYRAVGYEYTPNMAHDLIEIWRKIKGDARFGYGHSNWLVVNGKS